MKHLFTAAMAASAALLCSASEVSDAVNADIFRAIAPTGGASVVVSPYSAAFCAGLLGDGMDSRDARIALSSRLGMKTVEFGATFMRIRSQLSEWTLTNRVGVLFANSFWMRNYTRIDCDFHMMAHRSYDVAFGPLFGVEAMNAWTRARTDGLVAKAMDEVDLSCDTAIVSAAAFNGAWARPFPPAEPGAFHAPGGDVELPMMKDVRTVRGVRRPEYDAFALPYRGGRLFLYVMIPSGGRSPLDLVASLSAADLLLLDRALLPGYDPEDDRGNPMPPVEGASEAVARVTLPRIRVDTSADFLPALAALGVPREGYKAICENLRIGVALQRNVFETSETGGEVGKVDLPAVKSEGEPQEFACDRPFAFLVRTEDRLTLLAGAFCGK